jgi:hypothetical protein
MRDIVTRETRIRRRRPCSRMPAISSYTLLKLTLAGGR